MSFTGLENIVWAGWINANRGPWQLFARGPLLLRDKDGI